MNFSAWTLRLVGLGAAAAAYALDQGSKLWLLDRFDIAARQPVRLASFFDVVLTWNRGISYSLFTASTDAGRWMLLAATLAITAGLSLWMWRAKRLSLCAALGLIIGGALGNATDRWTRGAVADFFSFHIGAFHWYIFNLADCAIVGGVALLLLDSIVSPARPPMRGDDGQQIA